MHVCKMFSSQSCTQYTVKTVLVYEVTRGSLIFSPLDTCSVALSRLSVRPSPTQSPSCGTLRKDSQVKHHHCSTVATKFLLFLRTVDYSSTVGISVCCVVYGSLAQLPGILH